RKGHQPAGGRRPGRGLGLDGARPGTSGRNALGKRQADERRAARVHSASTLESPPIEPILVESNDPEGPFGAKEAGEGSLAAVIPAVSNAIYDAVGVWITSLPI